MKRSKYLRRKRLNKRTLVLLTSLALLIGIAAGATAAYIFTNSAQVTNTFEPARVDCAVQESFDGASKSEIKIQNTGNVDAYIRVRLLYNWVNDKDEIVTKPANYSYTAPSATDLGEGWFASNNRYYYEYMVKPQETTTVLTNVAITPSPADGKYRLRVDVIAEAIQAKPKDAVSSWGISPTSFKDSYAAKEGQE